MRHVKQALIVGSIGIGIILAALSLSSCGGVYRVEIPPIQVDVTHHISTSEFLEVFTTQCRRRLGPSATQQEVNDCAQDELAQFFTDLANALNK